VAEVVDADTVEPAGAGVGDERLWVQGVGSELGWFSCPVVEPGEVFAEEKVPRP